MLTLRCVPFSCQVIVPAMVGVIDNRTIKAVVKFLDWYDLACRTKEHTEASLDSMEETGIR